MHIKSKLSQQEYIKASFILLYSRISVLIFTGLLVVVFLSMIVAALILPDFSFTQILFPLAMLIAFPLATFFSAKRNYVNNPMTRETIDYQFDNNYFSAKGETFDNRQSWDKMYKVTIKKNWLLVWYDMQNANPIPRQDVSEVQVAEIKQILTNNNVKNNL
jgi:hypothetical protein